MCPVSSRSQRQKWQQPGEDPWQSEEKGRGAELCALVERGAREKSGNNQESVPGREEPCKERVRKRNCTMGPCKAVATGRRGALLERSPGSGRSQLARERSGNRQGNRLSGLDTGLTETNCTVTNREREEPNCSVVTQRETSQTVL